MRHSNKRTPLDDMIEKAVMDLDPLLAAWAWHHITKSGKLVPRCLPEKNYRKRIDQGAELLPFKVDHAVWDILVQQGCDLLSKSELKRYARPIYDEFFAQREREEQNV